MKNNGYTRRRSPRRVLSVLAVIALLLSLPSCIIQTVTPDDSGENGITLPEPVTETDKLTETEPDTDVIATVTETETETELQIDPVRLSFVGMGDNIVYNCTMRQAQNSDGSYDFLPLYGQSVRSMIKEADIAFINQETPMCGSKYGYHSYPQFNTPNQMGYDLIKMGFDVISFANNHMADMGYDSRSCVADMIDFTDTLDAFIIGLYRDEADFNNVRIYEKEGVKIAFLAYTYETNLFHKKTQPEGIVGAYLPVYDEETVRRQVSAARELADFVFVSIHWGTEDSHKVNDEQSLRKAHSGLRRGRYSGTSPTRRSEHRMDRGRGRKQNALLLFARQRFERPGLFKKHGRSDGKLRHSQRRRRDKDRKREMHPYLQRHDAEL